MSLEDYEKLSIAQRCEQKKRLKEQNQRWLQETFSKLEAAWLVVVNGEVIAWGKSLKDLPLARQNVEVANRTGKFPFVFINDDFLTIEESYLSQLFNYVTKPMQFELHIKHAKLASRPVLRKSRPRGRGAVVEPY